MDLADALQIVLDLAELNALEPDEYEKDDPLHKKALEQWQAIAIVHDLATNQFGDD